MKLLSRLALLSAICVASSCNSKNNETENSTTPARSFSEIKKAEWLLGKWRGSSAQGMAVESWDLEGDSSYAGKSYFIVGKDTVSSESIRLVQEAGTVFYIPTVKDQNNGQPVRFSMTSSTNDQLAFENPAHDFPQKISYTRVTSDSLVAVVSGKMKGKESAQEFPMKRTD
jgi:hypothetical protein